MAGPEPDSDRLRMIFEKPGEQWLLEEWGIVGGWYVQEVAPRFLKYANRRTRNLETATVIVADFSERAMRCFRAYDPAKLTRSPTKTPLPALWVAFKHHLSREIRRRKRQVQGVGVADADPSPAEPADTHPDSNPAEALVRKEKQEEIRNVLPKVLDTALARLRLEDARILRMFYFEGKSCTDIEQVLGISGSAVKMRLARARDRLAEDETLWPFHDGAPDPNVAADDHAQEPPAEETDT